MSSSKAAEVLDSSYRRPLYYITMHSTAVLELQALSQFCTCRQTFEP